MKTKLFILILICTSCTHIESKPTKVLFNIPVLVRSNIDEIVTTLGKPIFYPKPTDNEKSYCEYEKDGWRLSIRYYPNTRKVIEFSIFPSPLEYDYKNFKDVLRVGNLDSVAFDYLVIPGSELSASPGTYTDVTVVPKY